jgi:hypothetical protein
MIGNRLRIIACIALLAGGTSTNCRGGQAIVAMADGRDSQLRQTTAAADANEESIAAVNEQISRLSGAVHAFKCCVGGEPPIDQALLRELNDAECDARKLSGYDKASYDAISKSIGANANYIAGAVVREMREQGLLGPLDSAIALQASREIEDDDAHVDDDHCERGLPERPEPVTDPANEPRERDGLPIVSAETYMGRVDAVIRAGGLLAEEYLHSLLAMIHLLTIIGSSTK